MGHRFLRAGVGGVGPALPQVIGVPRQVVAPGAAARVDLPFEDGLVDALRRALLELLLEVVTGLRRSREQDEPARVAVDPVHDEELGAGLVAEVVGQQVQHRHFLAFTSGQRLDDQPRRLVDGDDRGVLVHEAEQVQSRLRVAVGRPGGSGPVHPDAHRVAGRQMA